jgi:hypothetical protein
MKLLKLAIISFIGLFTVITVISLLMPSQVRISRAVDISAPKEKILTHIYYMPAWKEWNKFIDSLPSKALTNNFLKNDQLTIAILQRSDSMITANWQQKSGTSFNSGYILIPQPGGSLYTMQWYFDFKLRWYPWEKFQSIVYDQQLGPVMEQSLQQLKKDLER